MINIISLRQVNLQLCLGSSAWLERRSGSKIPGCSIAL